MNLDHWKEQTVKAADVTFDVRFYCYDKVYTGDPDSHIQIGQPKFYEDLYVPFSGLGKNISISHIKTDISELIKYYESVLAANLMERSLKSYFLAPNPTLVRTDDDDMLIGFTWKGVRTNPHHAVNRLLRREEGEIYYDRDDGQEIIIEHINGKVFFLSHNPDQGQEEIIAINFPVEPIVEKIELLLADTDSVMEQLTNHFGFDYWNTL